ncbi:hypothetical protein LOTGIDRAFT_165710 [Lottia gigantea]|uniref:Arrestin C-terminal-like domain-containing protein n=1 Tax=Lottia gigantea TaxID=225164 RepID=V3ZB80_LOTGI|nr:hypothetical protein LOTGIDRAFT_165710 [Lottia gigantea]ESO88273.1 hypothetical protein LOTGIDRAFT_165710 [Lottia gigantea]
MRSPNTRAKISYFLVTINNDQNVFNPGDEISLTIHLKVLEPLKVRGIHLKICGQCYVLWGDKRSGESKRYEGEDNFITERKVVWGEEGGSEREHVLSAGEYAFTENYILPLEIPSSFEGKYGHVRYWAKAKIYRRNWKQDISSEESHFSVNGVIDLNEAPHAQEVVIRSEEKSVCCWCCKCGSYSVVFRLDHRGFVISGPIFIMAEISNNSTNYVTATAYLIMVNIDSIYYQSTISVINMSYKTPYKEQKTTFKAENSSIKCKVVIAESTHESIKPGGSDIWNDPILIPPETQPTNLGASTIIGVDYTIQFHIQTDGCDCDDIKFKEKIILGTVPLNMIASSSIMLPNDECTQQTPLIAPPSYDECINKPSSSKLYKQDSLPSYSEIQSYPLHQQITRI